MPDRDERPGWRARRAGPLDPLVVGLLGPSVQPSPARAAVPPPTGPPAVPCGDGPGLGPVGPDAGPTVDSTGGTCSSGATTGADPGEAHPWTAWYPGVRCQVGSPWPNVDARGYLRSNLPPRHTVAVAECIRPFDGGCQQGRATSRGQGERWGNAVTSGNEFSRRSFLSRGAAAGGLVMLGAAVGHALAGCSSGPSTSATLDRLGYLGTSPGSGRAHPRGAGRSRSGPSPRSTGSTRPPTTGTPTGSSTPMPSTTR